jgi:hypothetical protein|nr:MAG TPA: hypothetical protein [Caudoviricetes sp.]
MNKNELFANKLEELIISEVEEKVEKLKGLNVLEATLKLTSEDLYKYIDTNIGDAENFTLLAKINGNYEIDINYYYKNKLIQAVSQEGNKGIIDIYTLLKICVLQNTNTPAVEFTIHKCEKFGKETLSSNELSELNSLADCKCESCESCKYYKKEEVNLLKNN